MCTFRRLRAKAPAPRDTFMKFDFLVSSRLNRKIVVDFLSVDLGGHRIFVAFFNGYTPHVITKYLNVYISKTTSKVAGAPKQIERVSCRGRVEISVRAVAINHERLTTGG